jgi:DNA gyrase subunit A
MSFDADVPLAVYATDGRCLIFSTAQLLPKTTRNTQGVSVMALKKKSLVSQVLTVESSGITNESRYRTKTIPAAGALIKGEDTQEKQVKFDV